MRRLVAAVVLGAGLLVAVPAYAGPAQEPGIQECLDRVSSEEIQRRGVPSCRQDENGDYQPYWPAAQTTSGASRVVLVLVVIAFAALLGALPIYVAYRIARDNGQSTGVALVLGILLGWIGVLIVYFTSRDRTRA